MPNALHRLLRSSVVHVLFAFLAMGSWAVFANRAHAMPLPLYAGLVQGTISACLTLFPKSVIDWLSKRFVGSMRFWAPPLIACIGSASKRQIRQADATLLYGAKDLHHNHAIVLQRFLGKG
ncbi:hypothetical protein ACS4RR_029960 (plasmid) [Rhizobium sp. Z1P35]